ncbi:PKD domain-containing protein [Candidatus Bipolaricaulota bacterium]|nr:PKD domain-containing protein [Candidatus Bipolaricaulota bacterium]
MFRERKLILLLVASLLLLLFSCTAAGGEGNPWLGFLGYMVTGGPPSNDKPLATFSVDQTSGSPPLTVRFDATASQDPDGSIESRRWDFADGTGDSGSVTSHTFTDEGEYTVTLTVKDDEGAEDTFTQRIRVRSEDRNPVASFDPDPKSGEVPLFVAFDASGSVDPDGSIDEYEWDFGDGDAGSGSTVNHTFEGAGIYPVKLTVTDDGGNEDSETETISAYPGASYDSFSDPRDGKSYKTVKIGDQTWFAENINYEVSDGLSKCYDNNNSYCDTYGRLYSYSAATKACPSGWHLPSQEEWCTLLNHIDSTVGSCGVPGNAGDSVALGTDVGKKMKETHGWDRDGNGTDAYGFSGLPAGLFDGGFHLKDTVGAWWTPTCVSGGSTNIKPEECYTAISFGLVSTKSTVEGRRSDTSVCQSVRCIKDTDSSGG